MRVFVPGEAPRSQSDPSPLNTTDVHTIFHCLVNLNLDPQLSVQLDPTVQETVILSRMSAEFMRALTPLVLLYITVTASSATSFFVINNFHFRREGWLLEDQEAFTGKVTTDTVYESFLFVLFFWGWGVLFIGVMKRERAHIFRVNKSHTIFLGL